jgi:hypothetical protein
LIEAARGHLDGLVDLARRNGLDLKPLINESSAIDLADTDMVSEPIDIMDQPAAS